MTKLEAKLTSFSPIVLSLFRIVFGLLLTIHGTQKLFAYPVGPGGGGPAVPMAPGRSGGPGSSSWSSACCSSSDSSPGSRRSSARAMAFAYFTQHQPKALWPIENGGELAVLYCFGFFLLVFLGGGA